MCMSNNKTWISIAIVLIVLAGVWYVWSQMTAPGSPAPSATHMSPTDQMNAPTSTAANASAQGSLTSGASDTDLNADLQTIDTQSGDAQSASASANSFTDTPIPQAQ